jgi:hypothetical protein
LIITLDQPLKHLARCKLWDKKSPMIAGNEKNGFYLNELLQSFQSRLIINAKSLFPRANLILQILEFTKSKFKTVSCQICVWKLIPTRVFIITKYTLNKILLWNIPCWVFHFTYKANSFIP